MSDPNDDRETTDTMKAPPEDNFPLEEEPKTNRGKQAPDLRWHAQPPPVPPPGSDEQDLGGLIARMEATLDDIEGAAARLDASSKIFVGQARTFHQEVRLWMDRMEGRVKALEDWRLSFADDGK